MERKRYLAHIAMDGREQTVLNHLTETARLCAQFAACFHAESQGELAGLAHDLGKYSSAFQRRLLGGPRVDHSTAGAVECVKTGHPYAAFSVLGHHSGLPDGGGMADNLSQPTFFGRMNRAAAGKLEPCDSWKEEITLPQVPALTFSDPLEGMFFTRMLYSCLVDADYLDTEAFMQGNARAKGGKDTVDILEQRLLHFISNWFPPKTELNRERCAVLNQCISQGEMQAPGLFTLTIPTGGGKTVASLAFALRHAQKNGLRRIVYVIPYTSIIEQTAQTFRDILGDQNVLEHHSGVLYDIEDEAASDNISLALATENWDLPVVVTTAVQFFESLFANRSSRCRKLHNLAQSVIIFDEAQMLPIPYLRPCVFAISQLVKRYGVSAVLCTATQPALDEIFHEFLPEVPAVELCEKKSIRQTVFQRVTFRRAGKLSWDELAEQLNFHKQVLCIVNSRKSAQKVYERLNQDGSFHLSTLMYPDHRRRVLAEIRRRLTNGLPCRVISTSLIEAGVDVDFPAVFREEAGLDSILQAAGRCNREGNRPPEESIVTIFQGPDPPPPLFDIPIAAGRQALDQFESPDDPEAIRLYFHELLHLKGTGAQDQKKILSMIREERMPFKSVSDRFHLIDSETQTVYIPQNEGKDLVERLYAGEWDHTLFRSLGQYAVSIYPQHFEALLAAGDLELLKDKSAVLINMKLYSPDTGLSLEADFGKDLYI